ncbi:MAG TPA: hypothetical protein VM012_08835 [Flavitalea sp.]|nr:hypothetical protein [Flavitalea sp.]
MTNIAISFLVKGLGIISTFLLVPLCIAYVQPSQYGLWLTINSVVMWIGLFDLGLTNGLKNQLTEAFAKRETVLARQLISTTYAILFLAIVPLCIVFFIVCPYINWQHVFNTDLDNGTLTIVLRVAFISFCIQLMLQPLSSFLMAMHKHYLSSLLLLFGNLLAMVVIIAFGRQTEASFLFLSLCLSIAPALIILLFSVILFRNTFRKWAPAFAQIDFTLKRKLFSIGIQFFLIQVAGLIMYASNNFIIAHVNGNASVTTYNIVFRYFTAITLVQTLILSPFWTGFTDAYVLKDFEWIRRTIQKVNTVAWILSGILLMMLFISNNFYKFWIGKEFQVENSINILFAVSVAIGAFAANYTVFVNATGKIRLQTVFSIVTGLLHIPVTYLFMKSFHMNLQGLVAVNILWMTASLIMWSTQYKKIMAGSNSGIWSK